MDENTAIVEEWKRMPATNCAALVNSMPRSIKAVLDNNGVSRFMDLCAHSVFVYVGGPARCACQRCLVTVHLTR